MWSVGNSFAYFSYKKSKRRRFGTPVPTYNDKIKARRRRAFCVRYQLGLSAPNPDTRDFSGKVPWNLKNFAKIKWRNRREILLPTFLIRKVGSLAYLSFKKGTVDFVKTHKKFLSFC